MDTPVVFNNTYGNNSHWQVYHGSRIVGYMLGRWESDYEVEESITWRLYCCATEDEPGGKGEIVRGNLSFVTGYAQAYFEAKYGMQPLDPPPPCADCNGVGCFETMNAGEGNFIMVMRIDCPSCEGTGRELPQSIDSREPQADDLLAD